MPAKDLEVVEDWLENLKNECVQRPRSTPMVGDMCLYQDPSSGLVFRVNLLSRHRNGGFMARKIDFGDTVTVQYKDLYGAPPHLLSRAPLAYRAFLSSFQEFNSHDKTVLFENLRNNYLLNDEYELELEILDYDGEKYTADLLL